MKNKRLNGQPLHEQILFTTGQIADICVCAPRTVATWIDKGVLKGIRLPLSQDRRVERIDLIEFLKAHSLWYAYDKLQPPANGQAPARPGHAKLDERKKRE